ncbi:serine/threonine-protein kinase [Streptomyces xanthii]|uniref:non-specific serine/threonine protein kinase n=1 Tax=Streptomyces xanthii TaxID=2768069 RepID=A0A7H1B2P3_9ACTN|nr:serine/threonine-protein kinase [Streptomyces xanthii]QNS02998.1 serine/threonine protein kinase [Streptomyces xanthii]
MSEYTGEAGDGRLVAGRYRVVGRLGRGGMGTVWRAVDETLRREVAVKELRSFSDADAQDLAEQRLRMQREARAAARVRHPGVVSVYDVTEHEGRPVIVMELVDGPSLDGLLRERGALEPAEAARIGAEVMDALAAAHAVGVLHRDVKPGNILLERTGRVVLTDFGIAAMDEPDDGAATRLTRSGEVIGSLDYLAPERARGGEPGPEADVWALGATLYAAVEGVSPFRRTSTWSTITAIVSDPLPPPRRAGALLTPALAELLEKDPLLRADAVRAAQVLHAVAAGQPLLPGSPDTVRLGRAAPVAPAPAGQFGPPQGPRTAPSAPVAAPHGSEADTERRKAGGRRRAAVAGAVAAVLLAGAGATYLVTSRDDGGGGGRGTEAADSARPGARHSAGDDAGSSEFPEGDGDAKGDGKKGGGDKREGGASGAPSADASGPAASRSASPTASAPGGDKGSGGDPSDDGASSGSGGSGGADGGSGGGSDGPSCGSVGGGKVNCEVWRSATSYDSGHRAVGTLNQGTNYFYCQAKLPYRETYGQWTNVWWAKTDDDSGNANVYVSAVYLKGGENDQPVPGLPVC